MHELSIIHIFDDDKFIDGAIRLFEEAAPGRSVYYVIHETDDAFKYVKSPLAQKISLSGERESEFISSVSDHRIFFIHALNTPKQRIVNRLPPHSVKVWFVWGYDLYSAWKLFRRGIFEKYTSAFVKKRLQTDSFKEKILVNSATFRMLSAMRNRNLPLPARVKHVIRNSFGQEYYEAVHKIDVVAPVVPTEYEFVRRIGISPVLAPFSYGSMDDYITDFSAQITGSDILVGNSGDPSNNHADVFHKLSKFDLGDRKIIVPLNYACPAAYRNFVLEQGERLLGANFHPLLDFMPLEKYNQTVSGCGIVIFNHIRQQALGNLLVQGYSGAKIFLNPKSPVYRYFKQRDVRFFSIDELTQQNIASGLDAASRQRNRDAFTEMYGRPQVLDKVASLLEIVSSELKKKPNA